MISRANYEEWIIDYMDSQLDSGGQKMLFEFLENNPDLKEEFFGFENVSVPESCDVFSFKSDLKKLSGIDGNLDELLVAELEGDLVPIQIAELQQRALLEPNVAKFRRLYQFTRVKPSNITFSGKRQLKKGAIPFIPFRYYAAASVIVLFISWWFLRPASKVSVIPNEISVIQTPIDNVIPNPTESIHQLVSRVKSGQQNPTTITPLPKTKEYVIPLEQSPVETYAEVEKRKSENQTETIEFNGDFSGVIPISTINIEEPIYNKVEQILRNQGERKLAKITGDPTIAKTVVNAGESKNARLVKLATWASERFSGGRIEIIPQEDFEGKITAVVLTAPGVEMYRTLK